MVCLELLVFYVSAIENEVACVLLDAEQGEKVKTRNKTAGFRTQCVRTSPKTALERLSLCLVVSSAAR